MFRKCGMAALALDSDNLCWPWCASCLAGAQAVLGPGKN